MQIVFSFVDIFLSCFSKNLFNYLFSCARDVSVRCKSVRKYVCLKSVSLENGLFWIFVVVMVCLPVWWYLGFGAISMYDCSDPEEWGPGGVCHCWWPGQSLQKVPGNYWHVITSLGTGHGSELFFRSRNWIQTVSRIRIRTYVVQNIVLSVLVVKKNHFKH